jgi:hypothetical protein
MRLAIGFAMWLSPGLSHGYRPTPHFVPRRIFTLQADRAS